MSAAEHLINEAHEEALAYVDKNCVGEAYKTDHYLVVLRGMVAMAFETGYLRAIRKYGSPE